VYGHITPLEAEPEPVDTQQELGRALEQLASYDGAEQVDADFLKWAEENVAEGFSASLADSLEAHDWKSEPFYELFGETLHVLLDRYHGEIELDSATGEPVTLAFAGDVNLADDWENMLAFRQRGGGVAGAIAAPLLERMKSADVLMVNNEFCISDGDSPAAGKEYTFRAAVENTQLYHEMGVDVVSLANNHVFDYGEEAFLDTLDALASEEIPYAGAGRSLDEAAEARYFYSGGMKIAYLAAAPTEDYLVTLPAGEEPGVLDCYDGSLLRAVAAARENADWVVVYMHWGLEYEPTPGERQTELAESLIDSGADLIVGAHPHVLQGIEFYKEKPIVYSLGNFWFNVGWVDSALLEMELLAPGEYRLAMLPCATEGGTVRLMEHEGEGRWLLDYIESISETIQIENDGAVTPAA
jgi:poly-gamma-glutamate synthesis protein (capsule biosynthesis protein)